MKQLEAHEVPLHKIFCSDYDFQIPDYQRPYAWETEQAVQLLEDLIEALERNDDEPYFLGSIVLVKPPNTTLAEVIDGQQRLTTLTILLAVLRDLTTDGDVTADLENMIRERGNKIRGLDPKARLALRARDTKFFHNYIQTLRGTDELPDVKPDAMSTDAQKAMQANAGVLREKLADWSDEQRLQLIQMLGERTFLVVVSTADLDSAHRIFSVMNDRGLDLSPADIFKSKVIGNLPEDASDEYAKKWDDAEQALERDGFADLFLHIRMIFAKERAKRELLKEFPDQVLNAYLPNRAREFVDAVVVPYAEAYQELREQTYSAANGAEKVNRWLKRLVQLDNSDWRPPALWALRHHGDDPVWLDEFFRSLERLAASMLIRRVYTSPRSNRYADLLRNLDDDQGLHAQAFELSPQEKAETLSSLDGELYLATKVRKYVLLRLDEVLAGAGGVVYDHPLVTVEHVLPQNPSWDSEWLRTFSPAERVRWTHRIANLVVLNRAKNSQAQNFDFDKKKERYFTSKKGVVNFALTSQVLNQQVWTPSLLQTRQEELLAALSKEWGLD